MPTIREIREKMKAREIEAKEEAAKKLKDKEAAATELEDRKTAAREVIQYVKDNLTTPIVKMSQRLENFQESAEDLLKQTMQYTDTSSVNYQGLNELETEIKKLKDDLTERKKELTQAERKDDNGSKIREEISATQKRAQRYPDSSELKKRLPLLKKELENVEKEYKDNANFSKENKEKITELNNLIINLGNQVKEKERLLYYTLNVATPIGGIKKIEEEAKIKLNNLINKVEALEKTPPYKIAKMIRTIDPNNPVEFDKFLVVIQDLKKKGVECSLENFADTLNKVNNLRKECKDGKYAIQGMLDEVSDLIKDLRNLQAARTRAAAIHLADSKESGWIEVDLNAPPVPKKNYRGKSQTSSGSSTASISNILANSSEYKGEEHRPSADSFAIKPRGPTAAIPANNLQVTADKIKKIENRVGVTDNKARSDEILPQPKLKT